MLLRTFTGTVKPKPVTPKLVPVEPMVPFAPMLMVLFQKKLFKAVPAVMSEPLIALSTAALVAYKLEK